MKKGKTVYTTLFTVLSALILAVGCTDVSDDGGCANSKDDTSLQNFTNYLTIENNKLISCDAAATGVIEIPDGVTSIKKEAFKNCSNITDVIIPDSVTTIGDHAFRDCSSLTSVTIPDGVTTIGDYVFLGCDNCAVTVGANVVSKIMAIMSGMRNTLIMLIIIMKVIL